jgi:tRNA-splicing ligase RtcB (3'-phosphate/5'-hydroxy nucleic acid ligase)
MELIQSENKIPIKSWCDHIESGAITQARNLSTLPFIFKHIALMPDCHEGFGIPIGGVIACTDVIIPNAVGVDIGCGMSAVKTDIDAAAIDTETIRTILNEIRLHVPMGFDHHKEDQSWDGFDRAPDLSIIQSELSSAKRQLGTLGGGNHFMEIQKGDDDKIWLMVHSGSRNFGYKIAGYYHEKAMAFCEKRQFSLPDRKLAYLPMDTREAMEYKEAMDFAMLFALANRGLIKQKCMETMKIATRCRSIAEIDIHHNYAAQEKHFGRSVIVHRKGATSAKKGQVGIIPGSMGTASYIVRGKGNTESFMSCSHGAGRAMGRNEANRRLTLEGVRIAMKGIVFDGWRIGKRKKIDLSEAPQAYKNIETVMEAQKDLVEIQTRLTPLGVLKG